MEKSKLEEYANHLMFRLSDDELASLEEDFVTLSSQIALLDKIDTSDVEAMVYPFDVKTTYLRDDVSNHILSQEQALANAPKQRQGHFVLPRVVK